jgi:hypothetical protein
MSVLEGGLGIHRTLPDRGVDAGVVLLAIPPGVGSDGG